MPADTVYPNSKETYVQTLQRFWRDAFKNQRVDETLQFHGNIQAQTVPAANTIYLAGEEGNTIYMSEGSVIVGDFNGVASATDGKVASLQGVLEASRPVGGNVTAKLTPLTDGTPITTAGAFTVTVDTELQAVLVQFTPAAGVGVAVKATYNAHGTMQAPAALLPTTVAAGN